MAKIKYIVARPTLMDMASTYLTYRTIIFGIVFLYPPVFESHQNHRPKRKNACKRKILSPYKHHCCITRRWMTIIRRAYEFFITWFVFISKTLFSPANKNSKSPISFDLSSETLPVQV
jgi:hypothetical protein